MNKIILIIASFFTVAVQAEKCEVSCSRKIVYNRASMDYDRARQDDINDFAAYCKTFGPNTTARTMNCFRDQSTLRYTLCLQDEKSDAVGEGEGNLMEARQLARQNCSKNLPDDNIHYGKDNICNAPFFTQGHSVIYGEFKCEKRSWE